MTIDRPAFDSHQENWFVLYIPPDQNLMAIPFSTISTLSSGEFVGMVAYDPQNPISLKTFHSRIIINHNHIANEEASYQETQLLSKIDEKKVQSMYLHIKKEIEDITLSEMDRLLSNPSTRHLVIPKK